MEINDDDAQKRSDSSMKPETQWNERTQSNNEKGTALESNDTLDIDPLIHKRINRKFDSHILPWLVSPPKPPKA